jgi:ADP-ribosyltransferase-like protein
MKYLLPFNESDPSLKEFKKWFGNSVVTEEHNNSLIKKYNKELIGKPKRVFHKSKSRFVKFDESKDSGSNIFGKAFYFSTGGVDYSKFGYDWADPEIDVYLKLENPIDMNKTLSKSEALNFMKKWSEFAKVPIEVDLNWREEEKGLTWQDILGNQYGDLIQDAIDWSHEEYDEDNPVYNSVKPFLQSLGYDGFFHYCNSKTDYVHGVSDYTTYAVFSDFQIKRAGLI